MFLYFYKKTLSKHYKNIKLQMFPIATFYFGHFFILRNRDYGTKQSNVRTNIKYTSHINSFNTSVAIYSNDLTRTKKQDIQKHTKTLKE